MQHIFEIQDVTGRKIRLSKERWKHLSKHPDARQDIDLIKNTLTNPIKITISSVDPTVHYYYTYYKDRNSVAKYLRVIVKYINENGFIITAHYMEKIT